MYDTADAGPARPLPPRPEAPVQEVLFRLGHPTSLTVVKLYDSMDQIENPDELVGFLNNELASSHIYGDEAPDGEIYGDGQTGWGYLDVDPEALYGDLVDM